MMMMMMIGIYSTLLAMNTMAYSLVRCGASAVRSIIAPSRVALHLHARQESVVLPCMIYIWQRKLLLSEIYTWLTSLNDMAIQLSHITLHLITGSYSFGTTELCFEAIHISACHGRLSCISISMGVEK